jgi:N-acetylneuraminic acid mutarotase
MNHARAAHAVVSTGKAIYALGGTGTHGAPVLAVEQFDGKEWKDEGTIPGQGINAPAAAAVTGKIYLIGGFNTVTNVPTNQVYIYDTATRKWDRGAPLPRPRGGHSAAVHNGRIHVVGGGNSQSTIRDHDVYDPGTDTWKSLAPLPRGVGSPALATFAGKLYAIGGRSDTADFGTVEIYDPATNTWTKGPPIEPRGTAGAIAYCSAIYVFGGESQDQGVSLGEVLRWKGDGPWQQVSPMPTARNFARAVAFDDAIYVVGGSKKPGPSHASEGSAIVERFTVRCP